MNRPHTPVLVDEVLHHFEGKIKVFFEGTVGAGGHAKALLERHPEIETYLACDQDEVALGIAKSTLEPWKGKVCWIQGNFEDLDKYLECQKIQSVDGFLFDLGVSSMQFDEKERGFSFQKEAKLDMRMNQNQDVSAYDIVNDWPEEKLKDLFQKGEEKRFRRAASSIVRARKKKKIETTLELAKILEENLPKVGKLHPATLIFQALRMAVNRELEVLETALRKAIEFLSPKGKLGVISFQSLEDRIVKNIFKEVSEPIKDFKGAIIKEAGFLRLTKKVVMPNREESKKNPRARSAKFRVLQRLGL